MYFTSGQDRAFERLMQEKSGFDHYDGGGANAPEDCGSCRFYRPDWKYQYCVYAECPYQPGKLTAFAAVKFTVKGADDDMAVFRVEKNKGYTVMSNHHLRNKALSLKAKGLLSQMLSLPEDWDYTLKGLSLINRESIDAIRTAVWELERAGYIKREQGRDAKGKMADMVYTIYEQPVLDKPVLENPVLENPTSDNPTSDNPASGNPTQLNKEIQRTNLPRKEKLNTDGQITDSIPFPSLTPAPVENEAAATPPERKGTGKDAAVQIYREILLENIEYDYLIQDSSIDREQLDEIVDLMLETVCTSRKTIRIAGDDYPAELVKSKFMKLNSEHMCGAVAPPAPVLIAAALSHGSSIIPAGMWDGWGRRAYTTSVPLFPVRRPSPATLCFLLALMTPPACLTSACMWAIRSCCTAATPFPTQISIQTIGNPIFTVSGVCPDARKEF